MNLLFLDLEVTSNKNQRIKATWGCDFDYFEKWEWFKFNDKKLDAKYLSKYENFIKDFSSKILNYDYYIWHNIIDFDLSYMIEDPLIDSKIKNPDKYIDTLYLSTLIYINKPYHHLVKGYKLKNKSNDPLEDSKESAKIFADCINVFDKLEQEEKNIYYTLLLDNKFFRWFFLYCQNKWNKFEYYTDSVLVDKLKKTFSYYANDNFDLLKYLKNSRFEIAYLYRLYSYKKNHPEDHSLLPVFIKTNYPTITTIKSEIKKNRKYDLLEKLQFYYWKEFKSFREYTSKNWNKVSQWFLVKRALDWENILAILATWWGKSLTFQLPALINSELWSLSIVISPLQSLMKDQVDSLNLKDIQNVWYLNWLLSQLERKEVIEQLETGWIDLLYVSPEMLRSKTILKALSWRDIDRIIIDEAHCFSKWWHDFRPDYMFIADFIKELWKQNHSIYDKNTNKYNVKISCFTATAKREVIQEIYSYFKQKLDIELKLFNSTVRRNNLHYSVFKLDTENEKKKKLCEILDNDVFNWEEDQSCIVFVRTRKQTRILSEYLNQTYWREVSMYYHWDLESDQKKVIQDWFMEKWERKIIVATNAFWMWIDKNNVRYVIHYEIPDSLENYIQEAWRAWRDWKDSQCIIFYSEKDVDENFRLQKRSEVTERQVKKLVKPLFNEIRKYYENNPDKKYMVSVNRLIDMAKWIDREDDFERWEKEKNILQSKMKTVIYLLEDRWFLVRKFNSTSIFATSRHLEDKVWSIELIRNYWYFSWEWEVEHAVTIFSEILNWWIICVEEIPDKIWITMWRVKHILYWLQKLWLIKKENDIAWDLNIDDEFTSYEKLQNVSDLTNLILDHLGKWYNDINKPIEFDRKLFNTNYTKEKSTSKWEINDVLNFLKNLKDKNYDDNKKVDDSNIANQYAELSSDDNIIEKNIRHWKYLTIWKNSVNFHKPLNETRKKVNGIIQLSHYIIEYCDYWSSLQENNHNKHFKISIVWCIDWIKEKHNIEYKPDDIEEALIFMHRCWILKIESWLFMYITQYILEMWEKLLRWENFLKKDYEDKFLPYYEWKIKQIHFMQEYAIKLANNQNEEAEEYLEDYFYHRDKEFEDKYFKWRLEKIRRPMTEDRYIKLIKKLTDEQRKVVDNNRDNELIIAGPWAWKTMTLVHKVASLILNEWVRTEEFLLLTFSRAAKFELKKRIIEMLWSEWYWLEIDTFHWFSFKILWKEYKEKWDNDDVINDAIEYINKLDSLPYSVIVLDEFQDINDSQYELVKAIKEKSSKVDEMRIIATWDDDQNIYEFQWWNVKYIRNFEEDYKAKTYFLTENWRSSQDIINLSSKFIEKCENRIKKWMKLVSAKWETWGLLDYVGAINFNGEYYTCEIWEIVSKLIKNTSKDNTIWILCFTNEEVLRIAYNLKKAWFKDYQIALKWSWYQLDRTIEFYDFINSFNDLKEITHKELDNKYKLLLDKYWENKNLIKLNYAISDLKKLYPKVYKQNLYDFFRWISESDLWEKSWIIISTLHQAKWREFDSVILVFDDCYDWNKKYYSDSMRRLIYVWLTRAKSNLVIMWNNKIEFFNDLRWISEIKENKNIVDETCWEVINLTTSLSDVILSYNHELDLWKKYLSIWTSLEYTWGWLSYQWKDVVKFSKKFKEQLKNYFNKWYKYFGSKVYQRVVYPLLDEDSWVRNEVVIYLAIIWLRK